MVRSTSLLLAVAAVAHLAAFAAAQGVAQFGYAGKQHVPLLHLDSRHGAAADLDGDGDLDVVLAGEHTGGSNRWLRNDGSGVLDDAGVISVGVTCERVVAGDLDGDGRADLVWRHGGGVVIQRSTPAGFVDVTATWLPNAPALAGATAALGDIDADGDLDLALVTVASGIVLFANDGTGALGQAATVPQSPVGVGALELLDVDGDRDLDLFVGATGGGHLYINRGGLQFADETAQRLPAIGSQHVAAVVRDLDNDGDPDLVTLAQPGPSQVEVLVNTGGVFTAAIPALVGNPTINGIAVGDFDGDRDADLLLAIPQARSELYENLGPAGFRRTTGVVPPGNTGSAGFVAADLDADGDDDFVAYRQGQLQLLLGTGGILADATRAVLGPQGIAITSTIADIDRDGIADVAVSTVAPAVSVHWGVGHGQFATAVAVIALPERPAQYRFADLDRDGDLDAVVIASSRARLFENIGGRSFVEVTTFPATLGIAQTADVLDFDLDGLDDVIVGCVPDPQLIRSGTNAFKGLGQLRFANVTGTSLAAADGIPAWHTVVGDIDADGDPDLLTTSLATEQLLLNDGTGVFADITSRLPPAPGTAGHRAAFVDYDGDGDLDLVRERDGVGTAGRRIFLYRNDMPGRFTDVSALMPQGVLGLSFLVVDVDLDGDPDFVSNGGGLVRNQNGQLLAEKMPLVSWLTSAGDLDGDGDPDLLASGSPEVATLVNRHLQLELPRIAEPGHDYDLALTSRPGYVTGGLDVAFPFLGTRPAHVMIPGWGVLGVDPASIVPLPTQLLASPGGRAVLRFTLPFDPSLRGATFLVQAAILQTGAGQGLTAALPDVIE